MSVLPPSRMRPALFYLVIGPALACAAVAGVAIGSTALDWGTVVRVIGINVLPAGWVDASQVTAADEAIVWLIRLPRVLVAAIVGAGLATEIGRAHV